MFVVTAPSITPSYEVAVAETTVFVCPVKELNAMRVPPRPLNDKAPPFAAGISVQVAPALVERKMPVLLSMFLDNGRAIC